MLLEPRFNRVERRERLRLPFPRIRGKHPTQPAHLQAPLRLNLSTLRLSPELYWSPISDDSRTSKPFGKTSRTAAMVPGGPVTVAPSEHFRISKLSNRIQLRPPFASNNDPLSACDRLDHLDHVKPSWTQYTQVTLGQGGRAPRPRLHSTFA
jgi:hypothetical protein